jgi:hypothetical protein
MCMRGLHSELSRISQLVPRHEAGTIDTDQKQVRAIPSQALSPGPDGATGDAMSLAKHQLFSS